MSHTIEKLLIRVTTWLQTSSQSKLFTQSYRPSKSWESRLWEFRNSHLQIPGQIDIRVLVLWPGIMYPIRGKVVAFPKFGSWWVLWICVCSWIIRALRCSNYALINLLFDLCRSVWIKKFLINLPSPHLGTPAHPSTPKVMRTRDHAPTLPSNVFTFRLAIKSIKELGGVSLWFI